MKLEFIEVTAKYRFGQVFVKVRVSILPQNILKVDEMVEELPDYTDGVLSRITCASGEIIPLANSYEDVMEKVNECLSRNNL